MSVIQSGQPDFCNSITYMMTSDLIPLFLEATQEQEVRSSRESRTHFASENIYHIIGLNYMFCNNVNDHGAHMNLILTIIRSAVNLISDFVMNRFPLTEI